MTNKELKCLILAFEKIKEGIKVNKSWIFNCYYKKFFWKASESELEKINESLQNRKEQVLQLKEKFSDIDNPIEQKVFRESY